MRVNRSGVNVEPASAPAVGNSRHYRTRAASKGPRGCGSARTKLWEVPFENVKVEAARPQNSKQSNAPGGLEDVGVLAVEGKSWQESSIAVDPIRTTRSLTILANVFSATYIALVVDRRSTDTLSQWTKRSKTLPYWR